MDWLVIALWVLSGLAVFFLWMTIYASERRRREIDARLTELERTLKD